MPEQEHAAVTSLGDAEVSKLCEIELRAVISRQSRDPFLMMGLYTSGGESCNHTRGIGRAVRSISVTIVISQSLNPSYLIDSCIYECSSWRRRCLGARFDFFGGSRIYRSSFVQLVRPCTSDFVYFSLIS